MVSDTWIFPVRSSWGKSCHFKHFQQEFTIWFLQRYLQNGLEVQNIATFRIDNEDIRNLGQSENRLLMVTYRWYTIMCKWSEQDISIHFEGCKAGRGSIFQTSHGYHFLRWNMVKLWVLVCNCIATAISWDLYHSLSLRFGKFKWWD